ncbi:MAG: 4-oxalocrotonate decarboxylase, partial [Bacteroidetes bacterium]
MTTEYLARLLDDAAHHAQPIEQLSHAYPFSVDEAYDIQKASLERRYGRGERLIGLKMGFTSKAKMEQMGVFDLIWGRLTDAMLFDNGAQIPFDRFIHPRAEPEICFKIKKTID